MDILISESLMTSHSLESPFSLTKTVRQRPRIQGVYLFKLGFA